MARPKHFHLKWLLPVLLAAGLWLSHAAWMSALGRFLVQADAPVVADVAIVLGGDGYGHRVLKAADLVRSGFTRKVLVSGPEGMYGLNEAELAIPFAVRNGNPETWFAPVPNTSRSTREEAAALVPELRKLHVRRCLLVTSDYHTRRAGRLFRSAANEIDFRVISAPDQFFRADSWWRSREGRKCFVLEWMKTVASLVGI